MSGENAGQRCSSFLHRAIVISQFIFHRGLGLRYQCCRVAALSVSHHRYGRDVHDVDTKSVDFVAAFALAVRLRIDSLPSR